MLKKMISIGLWAAGGLFFLFSFCVLVCCLFILPREKTFNVARRLFSVLIRLMGIRLEVKGTEHVKFDKACLIMGNHQSLFDIFVIPAAIPLCFVGVEAAYHFSIPVWGYLVRKWGCIPIERNHLKKAIASLDSARKTLDSGMNIGILPEGHRTRTGKMGPFKKGPFHLAKASGADILPFGIKGLYAFHQKGSLDLNPGRVCVTIGRPIRYEEIKQCSVEEIREKLFDIISKLS